MASFLIQRLLITVCVVWIVVTLVFALVHVVPGDPVVQMLGEGASVTEIDRMRQELGLDRPILEQYITYMLGIVRGDLGVSFRNQEAVTSSIARRYPATIQLAVAAILFSLMIAVPFGVIAAVRRGSMMDRAIGFFTLLGVSLPNFTLGPLLIFFFSIFLGWLPVSGRESFAHLILPAVTMGCGMAAITTRMVRSSMLEEIQQDYVRTARAKGLPEVTILCRHALRNGLIPILTVMGLQFGNLLAGAIITEVIFSWPGLGQLTIQAINARDYPLVQGLVLALSAPALAQTGAVQGTVLDIDGTPLEGAVIMIDRPDNNLHFEATTDADGKFFHAGLPGGNYRIMLTVEGRQIQYIDGVLIQLSAATAANFDLKALADSLASTEEAKAAEAERLKAIETRDAFDRGREALDAKNYQEAVTQLKLAIENDDTQHVIFANLADAQQGARQFEDAAETYRKAIILAPTEAAYYNNLGIVLGSAGKIDEAIAALEKTAELSPGTAGQAYYNLGAVMTNTGLVAAAVVAFEKAIEFDPENTEAYYQLGISYFGSADTIKDAIPVLQKYLELAPDSPNAEAARQLIAAAGGI